jgi:hypothetical protein
MKLRSHLSHPETVLSHTSPPPLARPTYLPTYGRGVVCVCSFLYTSEGGRTHATTMHHVGTGFYSQPG